jgi:hypothetical protein
MVKRDSEGSADEGAGDESVAGRAARANVKRAPEGRAPSRSPGHVRAGAKALSREAQKIIRKHRARIDEVVLGEIEATVAEIERIRAQRPNEDIALLEFQAEHLDELLHHHASFARKSALRDTIENIGIAVLVALTVRSCVYEPFKIPSGSMMPVIVSMPSVAPSVPVPSAAVSLSLPSAPSAATSSPRQAPMKASEQTVIKAEVSPVPRA